MKLFKGEIYLYHRKQGPQGPQKPNSLESLKISLPPTLKTRKYTMKQSEMASLSNSRWQTSRSMYKQWRYGRKAKV